MKFTEKKKLAVEKNTINFLGPRTAPGPGHPRIVSGWHLLQISLQKSNFTRILLGWQTEPGRVRFGPSWTFEFWVGRNSILDRLCHLNERTQFPKMTFSKTVVRTSQGVSQIK